MSTMPPKGRGAAENPPNRFIPLNYSADPDIEPAEQPSPRTMFFRDDTRMVLSTNDSPDIPFDFSLNPYRGCEHGCVYCYARPTHEYLSFSSGLDFETKIVVKEAAPELLRKHFASKKWRPQCVSISGVTDAYQPIERVLRLTRRCLEVFVEFRNPVSIITKNALVARDADLLTDLAARQATQVFLSVTTLDEELANRMEPRASSPAGRFRAVRALADAGIPVGVMVAPIIPGLNDHEAPAILNAAAQAGARTAGYTVLRLPFALTELFESWLDRHYPDRKQKVLGRLRDARAGELNDSRFGVRMSGAGDWAETFSHLFRLARKNAGLDGGLPPLSIADFRRPGLQQATLF